MRPKRDAPKWDGVSANSPSGTEPNSDWEGHTHYGECAPTACAHQQIRMDWAGERIAALWAFVEAKRNSGAQTRARIHTAGTHRDGQTNHACSHAHSRARSVHACSLNCSEPATMQACVSAKDVPALVAADVLDDSWNASA